MSEIRKLVANEEGHLYHGTAHEFEPGDELTPEGGAHIQNHPPNRGGIPGHTTDRVHATTNLAKAQFYAVTAAKQANGTDRIYKVEHTGDILEPDPRDEGESAGSVVADKLTVAEELEWPEGGKDKINYIVNSAIEGAR